VGTLILRCGPDVPGRAAFMVSTPGVLRHPQLDGPPAELAGHGCHCRNPVPPVGDAWSGPFCGCSLLSRVCWDPVVRMSPAQSSLLESRSVGVPCSVESVGIPLCGCPLLSRVRWDPDPRVSPAQSSPLGSRSVGVPCSVGCVGTSHHGSHERSRVCMALIYKKRSNILTRTQILGYNSHRETPQWSPKEVDTWPSPTRPRRTTP